MAYSEFPLPPAGGAWGGGGSQQGCTSRGAVASVSASLPEPPCEAGLLFASLFGQEAEAQ